MAGEAMRHLPWTARASGDGDGLWTVYDAAGQIVFFGMDEATAKLFAAAPDMLAALQYAEQKYVALVESGDAGFWNPNDDPLVIKLRAAISRATPNTNAA